MSLFRLFSGRLIASMEKRAAIRVHEHLQLVSAENLIKAGISPELLAQGPAAYPWREEVERREASVAGLPVSDEAAIRLGIAELKACTDAELHDLGIARGDIAHVVRFGRPGVDETNFPGSQAAA